MSVPIDPFLYGAFLGGFVAGRFLPSRGRWLDRATLGAVLVLIALLGLSLGSAPIDQLISVVPVALAATGIVLALTIGVARLLVSHERPGRAPDSRGSTRPFLGLLFLADVIVGFIVGRFVNLPVGPALEFSLYVLLALVGWGMVLSTARLRRLWVPLIAAVAGAFAGGIFLMVTYTSAPVAFASTFGFGFYSLAGPLVATRAGATMGFLAFLTNFLRENLTMLLSPSLGSELGAEGLVAMGGATSMDTTLYFVTRFGDPEAASLALTSGLILTVVATLVLPFLLSLPGA